MKGKLFLTAATALALLCVANVRAQSLLKSSTTGSPELKSIEAITFGPNGMLAIADGRGQQIIVVDTKDTTVTPWSNMKTADILGKLAGRIGATAKEIEITKIAVNPASKRVYFAVLRRGDKKHMILTMDGKGKIGEFPLENVRYARVKMPESKGPIQLITDIAWADDRILVAAQANETFKSKILAIPVPVQHDAAGSIYSAETFHVAHNQWETRAPIRTLVPYVEGGKTYVVGAFTCTPVVKFRVDDLKAGAKVKGQSVLEVGNGNRPRDMFVYKKDGKKYVLMSTVRMSRFQRTRPVGPSPYWTVKIDYNLLAETEKINKAARRRVGRDVTKPLTDRAEVVRTFHGVMHMDKLDARRAAVIRMEEGRLNLEILDLP